MENLPVGWAGSNLAWSDMGLLREPLGLLIVSILFLLFLCDGCAPALIAEGSILQ
jgi:hypothetical protein